MKNHSNYELHIYSRWRYCPMCKINFQYAQSVPVNNPENFQNGNFAGNVVVGNANANNQAMIAANTNANANSNADGNVNDANRNTNNLASGSGSINGHAMNSVLSIQLPVWALSRRQPTHFKGMTCIVCNLPFVSDTDVDLCAACLARF